MGTLRIRRIQRGAAPHNVQDLLQGDICTTWQHNKSIQPSETKAQSHSRRINKETKRQGHNPHDINRDRHRTQPQCIT